MPDVRRTCEVSQAQLLKAVLPVFLVVDHYSQGVLVLVQLVAPDDAQVVQGQMAEPVDG